ncbi:probable inactive DNA (cytosine-5)-methyltransferase DRM3 isoform X2 [Cynara cardunculus var. scolymus]|uniref:probable inactive DNA (cytosine-5)-methyltransferase DRM3 isoform X2 n=1 Tax=Cynara cardunculus var. scolymus TaxID=59895 RepID=UPI000D6251D5|nr:probable inactive DNA (cytosine-5)-methyltransferase DRM3 isoform X2 [Cynara cardunculus var. scolymus]
MLSKFYIFSSFIYINSVVDFAVVLKGLGLCNLTSSESYVLSLPASFIVKMYEITNLSDSDDELKPETGTITKVEAIDYNGFHRENMYSSHIRDNGASSSGSNIRSSLIGMGFSLDLIEKAIRQNGEENMNLLLETLLAYSDLQTSKARSLHSANGSVLDKDEELAQGSGKRKAHCISHSESSDSLDCLFGDEKDISSRSTVRTTIPLKEDPDQCCNVTEDKKASLLMMNFTMEEIEFAMNKFGEDARVDELVDFIFAAQMDSADDSNKKLETKSEDATTETLFGTMDKTLRLLEIGFSEQEISAAIEKYGSEVSISELADSIVCDRMGGPCIKTEEDPFGANSWMTGNKFKSSSMGAERVLDASFYSNLALRTEESSQAAASQIRDFDIGDSCKGKQPKEETADELITIQRPKPEFDDLNSYSGPACTVPKPPVSSKVLQRQLKYKARRMAATGVPKLIQPVSCSSVDQMVAKAPLFFYGNVMNLSQDSWVKISQFLYAIEPEFVNTQFFSALSRKEGYIHNLPTKNRFHILPKPPMTIEEVIPQTKKYWPSWDTRKQLTCINSETIGISQLCDRLRNILIDSKGLLSVEQQKDLLHQCRSLNLMWVGRNRVSPIEPELVERILGYPMYHTREDGLSLGERLQSLKHSFQTDTLGYHLSVLKSMYPEGLTLLSIYSGVGGAEITLNRLGIRLKAVVSVEPSEIKRKILRQWWDKSDQTGELVQIENIQKLSSSKLESLIKKFGVFDFIICQNPYTYAPKSVTMAAAETESFAGLDFSLFYEFVRVLQRVRSAIKTS